MVNGPIMLSSSRIMIDNNHEDRLIVKGTKHELPSPTTFKHCYEGKMKMLLELHQFFFFLI